MQLGQLGHVERAQLSQCPQLLCLTSHVCCDQWLSLLSLVLDLALPLDFRFYLLTHPHMTVPF